MQLKNNFINLILKVFSNCWKLFSGSLRKKIEYATSKEIYGLKQLLTTMFTVNLVGAIMRKKNQHTLLKSDWWQPLSAFWLYLHLSLSVCLRLCLAFSRIPFSWFSLLHDDFPHRPMENLTLGKGTNKAPSNGALREGLLENLLIEVFYIRRQLHRRSKTTKYFLHYATNAQRNKQTKITLKDIQKHCIMNDYYW